MLVVCQQCCLIPSARGRQGAELQGIIACQGSTPMEANELVGDGQSASGLAEDLLKLGCEGIERVN